MKERPILFSAPMVRAILEEKKTQTRRIVKDRYILGGPPEDALIASCPYGKPGDQLWVREAFRFEDGGVISDGGGGVMDYIEPSVHYRSDYDYATTIGAGWKPSIHMPRSFSRISLEITGVRVERLQEISEGDAIAEGIDWNPTMGRYNCAGEYRYNSVPEYRSLWDSINKDMGNRWADNPWVWVVEFRRIKP